MIVTIIGSSDMVVLLSRYIPVGTSGIMTRGNRGVERIARCYAEQNGLPYWEMLPDYSAYGGRAVRIRNDKLITETEWLLAFWDGKSGGVKNIIEGCKSAGKIVNVYRSDSIRLIK